YDLHHFLERLPKNTIDDLEFPDMHFGFYDKFVVYDHEENRCFLVGRNLQSSDMQELTALLSTPSGEVKGPCSVPARLARCSNRARQGRTLHLTRKKKCQLKGNFTKREYLQAVRKAKEYIARGDIYQVNLSQRFHTELSIAPHELYMRLRGINPAPFSSYLQFGDNAIVSSSPERFLRVQSGRVQTCPIKGTRPRGTNPASDQKLMAELLNSSKDNAELTMIVDLERNDLGKVCNYGSVKVIEKRRLEAHPTVFHLVATIEGDLYPRYDLVDLLKATFPGGSVTGAPKIRAMEIIDELEPTSRSVYTGAIGYIGFDGSMDMAIAIRTFLIKGSQMQGGATAFFQAGGGIVADSKPEEEYRETLFKSRALIESLNVM
ncbi:MAG TPA: aminodeoxychorismate synthase component I, partial [Candidatus Hypogeohydataceae bacterium YC41]